MAFTVYRPNPLAYIGFGMSEGLRKHMEYMQQQQLEDQRNRQFQQQLDLQRQLGEAEIRNRADILAQNETQFNKSMLQKQAELNLQQEQFEQEKKVWRAEYGPRMEYLRQQGQAKETAAEAAATKAKKYQPGGKTPDIYTPGGLGKKYAELYGENWKTAIQAYGKDFTNVYQDQNLMDKLKNDVREQTRTGMTPYLNSYNSYVTTNPLAVGQTQLSWDDLEATPEVRGITTSADTQNAKDWAKIQRGDNNFTSRFDSLDLTDREIDLLRDNANDLYKLYVKKLSEGGAEKLKKKMALDEFDKRQAEKAANYDR